MGATSSSSMMMIRLRYGNQRDRLLDHVDVAGKQGEVGWAKG